MNDVYDNLVIWPYKQYFLQNIWPLVSKKKFLITHEIGIISGDDSTFIRLFFGRLCDKMKKFYLYYKRESL